MTHPMHLHVQQSNLIESVLDPDEVKRSLEAWDWLNKQDKLTIDVILGTHKRIMYKLLPTEAGRMRRSGVEVAGRDCPSPQAVEYLLDDWITLMQEFKTRDVKDMHVRFEHIHPFLDGNGRTGRMLMWWHEQKLGLEPTVIHYHQRWNYYDWF